MAKTGTRIRPLATARRLRPRHRDAGTPEPLAKPPAEPLAEPLTEPLADAMAAEALVFEQTPVGVPLARRTVVSPRYLARDTAIRRLLAGADAVAVLVGLVVAGLIARLPLVGFAELAPLMAMVVVVFKCYGMYDLHVRRIRHSVVDELPRVFHAVLVSTLLLWVGASLLSVGRMTAWPLACFGAFVLAAVPLLRTLARRAASSWLGPERVLLIGDDSELDLLTRKIASHPEYHLEPVGYLSHPTPLAGSGLPNLGDARSDVLAEVAGTHAISRVIMSRRGLERGEVVDVLRTCNDLRVKVSYLPQAFEGLGPSTEVDDIEGVTVLGINPPVITRSSRALKRAMDVVGAATLLLIMLPVIIAVAVAIKLDSRGPVFFVQSRIGRGGRRFKVLKFRTMVQDAEQAQAALREKSKDPGWLLLDDDPRVTRVGKFLRAASLDELPQLLNVLRGEMSLVGPRPIIESEDRQLEGWRRSRVDLTPGLTGMWQVMGRTSIPFEEMIKLDYLYVTNWSLWSDVRLILRTVPAVLSRRGVN